MRLRSALIGVGALSASHAAALSWGDRAAVGPPRGNHAAGMIGER